MTHKGTVTLETERLILRRFTLDDADAMFRNWASDTEVARFARQGTPLSVSECANFCEEVVSSYDREDFYCWAVVPKNAAPIGRINITRVDEPLEAVTISYMIGSNWWNRGYACEALSAITRFFFEVVGANRMEGRNDPQNAASEKVMIKCGFQYEGLLRQGGKNGFGLVDCKQYAILAKDYFAAQKLSFAPYDIAVDREFLVAAHKEAVALTFHTDFNQEMFEVEIAKRRDVRDGAYLDGKLVGICDLERRRVKDGVDCGHVNFF